MVDRLLAQEMQFWLNFLHGSYANESGGVITVDTRVNGTKTPFCNQNVSRVLAQSITCSLIQAVGLIFSNQPFRQLDNNNINLSSQQFCRSHFTWTYFYWVFRRARCVGPLFAYNNCRLLLLIKTHRRKVACGRRTLSSIVNA
jgi:hypothetical protein